MAEEIITTRHYYYRGSFVARIINGLIGIAEVLLLVRLVLELLGANAASPFVAWAYSISGALIGPFNGAFPVVYLTASSVLDVVAIVAMVGYALLGWLLIELLTFIFGAVDSI
jgi:hypothetical protein